MSPGLNRKNQRDKQGIPLKVNTSLNREIFWAANNGATESSLEASLIAGHKSLLKNL